jgi:hypothetical protein
MSLALVVHRSLRTSRLAAHSIVAPRAILSRFAQSASEHRPAPSAMLHTTDSFEPSDGKHLPELQGGKLAIDGGQARYRFTDAACVPQALRAAIIIRAQASASEAASWWRSGRPRCSHTAGRVVGRIPQAWRAQCTVHSKGSDVGLRLAHEQQAFSTLLSKLAGCAATKVAPLMHPLI